MIHRDKLSQSHAQEGGLPTATTYFKKHKISKGETIAQSLKDRFEYGKNPDKTQGGELISSYACDHMTADVEFLRTIQTCGGPLSNLVKKLSEVVEL